MPGQALRIVLPSCNKIRRQQLFLDSVIWDVAYVYCALLSGSRTKTTGRGPWQDLVLEAKRRVDGGCDESDDRDNVVLIQTEKMKAIRIFV